MATEPGFEPTLLTALWRRRWLVLAVMALALALGLVYSRIRGEEQVYSADASILLQDPALLTEGGVAGERFVTSQVEIIGSQAVIETAVLLLEEGEPSVETTPIELFGEVSLISSNDSALVVLTVTTDDPDEAVLKVNSLAEGFRTVSRLQVTSASTAAFERIDAQLESIEERRVVLETEIAAADLADPGLVALEQQMRDAVVRISELQVELDTATVEDAIAIRQSIFDLANRMSIYSQAQGLIPQGTELQALIQEQSQIIDRRAELIQLRDQILVDQDLARDAIALLTSADGAQELPQTGAARTVAVALILGALVGAGLSYLLEGRRRQFGSRFEPEALLGAPLLADIPEFAAEGLSTNLPVRDAPRSAAAEAFRFTAGSIESAMLAMGAKTVMVVAPTVGHGKTTVLVNTAVASARDGHSVLVIDSDFGNQEATALLLGDGTPKAQGLTEIVELGIGLDEAVRKVSLGRTGNLHLLGRGQQVTTAPVVLRSARAREVFEQARRRYDLVMVDAPPFLQVAYASLLAGYVDVLLIVVTHNTQVRETEELVARLRLVNTPVIGYIYNRGPLRPEMTSVEGSMSDILGDTTDGSGDKASRLPAGR